jgi:hypothetical protein
MNYLLIGSGLSGIIALFSIFIAYYFFEPAIVGEMSLITLTSMLITAVAGGRLETSLIRLISHRLKHSLQRYIIMLGAITIPLVSALTVQVSVLFGVLSNFKFYWSTITLLSLFSYVLTVKSSYFLSVSNYFLSAAADVFRALLSSMTPFLVFGVLDSGLVNEYWVSYFCTIFLTLLCLYLWLPGAWGALSVDYRNKSFFIRVYRRWRRILAVNRSLVLASLPSIFLNTISQVIPVFLAKIYFGADIAGYLHNSMKALNGPVQFVANPIRGYFYRRASSVYRSCSSGNFQMMTVFLRFFVMAGLVGSVIYACLFVAIKLVEHHLNEFVLSMIVGLIFFYLIKFPVFVTSNLTLVYRREYWVLNWNLAYVVLSTVVLTALGEQGVEINVWIWGYSIMSSAFYVTLWAFHFYLVKGRSF